MKHKLRVLIVEDSEDDALLLTNQLQHADFDVQSERVETEDSFIAALESKEWDIILCDYMMPKFNGMKALTIARERSIEAPFIFVSGKIGEESAIETMKAGASDYVMKGNPKRLIPAIERELRDAKDRKKRRQAEESLISSELRYRRLFEAAKDGILILDPLTGMILDANPFLVELLGYSKTQLREKPIWELGFLKDVIANEDKFLELQRKGYVRYDDLPLETIDGRRINVEFVSNLYEVNHQKVIQCNIRDITKRKRAEEALAESEMKYRSFFENNMDAILLTTPDGKILSANPAARSMFGYSEGELTHGGRSSVVDVKDPRLSELLSERALRGKVRGELTFFRKGGTRFPGEVSSALFTGHDGQALTSMIIRDITERIQTEKQIVLLAHTLKSVAECVSITDMEDNVLFANRAFLKTYGYTESEILGKNISMVRSPNNSPEAIRSILAANGMEGWSGELLNRKKDGSEFPILLSTSTVRDEDGQVIALVGVASDISGRKQAEESLRESERKYRSLFENSLMGISAASPDGHLVQANMAYARMYGYDNPDEMMAEISDIGHQLYVNPGDRAEVLQRLAEKGFMEAREVEVVRRDGTRFYVLVSAREVKDAGGRILYYEANHIDITDRKLTEEVLRKSQEQYRLIFDSSMDAIIIAAPTGEIFSANAAACELFGRTEEELRSMGRNSIVDVSDPGLVAALEERRQTGKFRGEFRLFHKDGTRFQAEVAHALFIDTEGRDRVCMSIRDITELKQMEEKLRTSEVYYRTLIEATPDAITIVDAEGMVSFASSNAYKLFEIPAGQSILGTSFLAWVHPDERDKTLNRLHEIFSHAAEPVVWEYRLQRFDGIPFWGEIKASRLLEANGGVAGLLLICRDVTEKKKLNQELVQSQKLQSIGTLAGGIAHDFNNILAIILGYSTFLDNTKITPERKAEGIVAIKNAVQRGAALVRQILTFARKSEVLFEPVNLGGVLHELVSMLQQTFPKIITFKEVVEPEIPLISADRSQVHQVILNLCVNARDAMPRGGTITISLEKETGKDVRERFPAADADSYLRLSVRDTGEGMTDATRLKIFDPFFTTKEKEKGTGLGLSVVFGVVLAHHGFIDVESEVARGTIFRLYFPVPDEMTIGKTPPKEEDVIDLRGTETVLLVEDEEHLLKMVHFALESNGYHVYAAQDGLEAVEMYREHHDEIALVLTDFGLPGMTGKDTFDVFRQINPEVKLLFMSGFIEPDVKVRLLQMGATGIIQKPYTPRELLLKLRAALDGKG